MFIRILEKVKTTRNLFEPTYLYYEIWWLDIPMHILGGMGVASLTYSVFLYKKIHIAHHLSCNPSPLTALSFHPVEAVIQVGIITLLVIIIPIHPVALFIFLFYSVITNVYGHSGFQLFPFDNSLNKLNWFNKLSKKHNEHHLYAKDNYGLYFTFWDILMKTARQEKI